MKLKYIGMITAFLALTLSGCGSSSSNNTTDTTTTTTTASTVAVGGLATKGPFKDGSTVTIYELNRDGTRTGNKVTGTTTGNLGKYSIEHSYTGLVEVEISGDYLDETDGSTKSGTVSAIIVVTPGQVDDSVANPNPLSTMSSVLTKKALLADPIPADADAAALETTVTSVKKAADVATAEAFGIPTKTASGKDIDLTTINLLDTANTETGEINKAALVAAATIQKAVNNTTGANINDAIANLATDVAVGKPLGATDGITATIATQQAAVVAEIATIASNITTVINNENDSTVTADTALATDLYTSAKTTTANTAVTLRALAMSGNTFTLDGQSFLVDTYGNATSQGGTTNANNVIFGFALADRTGKTAATTYDTVFSFDVYSTAANDKRKITGSVPVTIVTDGAGAVSATVPANAVMSFVAVDSQGVTATVNSATNIGADTVQASANVISINVNTLLSTIQGKIGASVPGFDVLTTTGTYAFTFSISGVAVGLDDGASGISQLLPLSALGRSMSGTVTTQ